MEYDELAAQVSAPEREPETLENLKLKAKGSQKMAAILKEVADYDGYLLAHHKFDERITVPSAALRDLGVYLKFMDHEQQVCARIALRHVKKLRELGHDLTVSAGDDKRTAFSFSPDAPITPSDVEVVLTV